MREAYRHGELVMVVFPFTDLVRSSLRPSLVVLDTGNGDVVVARITSQPARDEHDIAIVDWDSAGLMGPSIVRLHKLSTIEKRSLGRRLGVLGRRDWIRVREAVQRMWANI